MIAALAAAALAAAAPSDVGPSDTAKRLVDLQHIYAQSCGVRAYATYDDLCDKLKKQMRDAERSHRTAQRAQARNATPARD